MIDIEKYVEANYMLFLSMSEALSGTCQAVHEN